MWNVSVNTVISLLHNGHCLFSVVVSQVTCREFNRCYDDVNICLWTNGSYLSQSAAQAACKQRANSFLPRVTNSNIQSKMAEFRSAAGDFLRSGGVWIDVRAITFDNFHWIDGSPLNPGSICCVVLSESTKQYKPPPRIIKPLK